MSDYLLCCFYLNKHSTSRGGSNGKITLRHIDKSMIGLPTNFKHCAHIGYADVADTCASNSPASCTSSVQSNQMSTSGSLIKKNNSIKYPNAATHDHYNAPSHFLGPRSMTSNQPVSNQYHHDSLVSHLKLIDLKIA